MLLYMITYDFTYFSIEKLFYNFTLKLYFYFIFEKKKKFKNSKNIKY